MSRALVCIAACGAAVACATRSVPPAPAPAAQRLQPVAEVLTADPPLPGDPDASWDRWPGLAPSAEPVPGHPAQHEGHDGPPRVDGGHVHAH